MIEASVRLVVIKVLHTLVWAFFASAIGALWIFNWRRDFQAAGWMIALVGVEVLVLVFNGLQCRLTPLAARLDPSSSDRHPRRANFDIYLPECLARRNKLIFGLLYAAGALYTLGAWLNLLPIGRQK